MALSFSGRELTRAEEDRVLAVIRENTQIEILCIIEPNDKNEMMYRSVVEQSLSDIYKKEGIFYKGTLRKRQILEAEESIVILGDVELGAKVIAKGSVIIIGTLYGSVCAGASGDTSAYVVALSMQPKYLQHRRYRSKTSDHLSGELKYSRPQNRRDRRKPYLS